ncbi:uncharacterized protein LOC131223148 isoform X2 [Magnolia sinica]|uniref:uncharacterized protein LOC131223148 isoform X2 n=1 Tax=Magnolia sinica TaxID=86752 RepID=UPI00265A082B|nr:uncharacterized protein LOC131223148 isoform X2 [Magnolia sinica]
MSGEEDLSSDGPFWGIRCFSAHLSLLGSVRFLHLWGFVVVRLLVIIYVVKPELQQNRSCLGCRAKSTPIIAVDEPSKGLKIQGQTVKKQSVSEDLWSTSTYEMENCGVQSQRSISSIGASTQTLDHHSGAGSSSLLLWNQTRQQWIGNRRSENRTQQVQEPRLSWNATYEGLLGTNKLFPQPIPLSEMVDFLVDIWEQEGLYD